MSQLDDTLIRIYASLNASVDRIASCADLRADLRHLLPNEFQAVDDDQLVRRLPNLRKRGKLPRRNQTQGV